MLTGRPIGEFSTFGHDVVAEIQDVHRRARRVLHRMCSALWPEDETPSLVPDLVEKMRDAVKRFHIWKKSACREGAQEAWAMLKTKYTLTDTERLSTVGPRWPDGEEIPTSLMYDAVLPAARNSQMDCSLKTIVDDLDKELIFVR